MRGRVEVDEQKLADFYKQGNSLDQCVREFGIGYGTVYRILKSAGVELRPKGGPMRIPVPDGYEDAYRMFVAELESRPLAEWTHKRYERAGRCILSWLANRVTVHDDLSDPATFLALTSGVNVKGSQYRVTRKLLLKVFTSVEVLKVEVDEQKLADFYKQGNSLDRCGREFGIGRDAVRRILKTAGVEVRGRGRKKGIPVPEGYEDVYRMFVAELESRPLADGTYVNYERAGRSILLRLANRVTVHDDLSDPATFLSLTSDLNAKGGEYAPAGKRLMKVFASVSGQVAKDED